MGEIIAILFGGLGLLIPGFILLLLVSIRQVNQYQKGLRFMLGKYTTTVGPGWHIVIPVIQSMSRVDMRVKAVDVPLQESITRDNISVKINAVIYYKVVLAEKAILEVENFMFAVSQLAQTTMRNIVGEVSLDELLTEREKISDKIKLIVDKASDPWGVKVINVDLKDVIVPEEMKRTIAKQAEAERERRSVVIKAQGEVQAAENMAKAAKTLSGSTGALHLRTLQSINDLSSDQSNTVIFALPLEILRAFETYSSGNKPQNNIVNEAIKSFMNHKKGTENKEEQSQE
ncbi:slipin family protein [Patescibacteria group bacterium]|nr:slipin family protein [Patescibacteria group bacterium]